MTFPEPEQRRSERVAVDLRAKYRSSTLDLDGRVANLSRSGMFLLADFLDDEGAEVDLELEVHGHEPLRLRGEVVWVDLRPVRSGMGIRFGELDAQALRALANLVIERRYQQSGEV
jgi:uncharacterized protein (TIGR02266 family)